MFTEYKRHFTVVILLLIFLLGIAVLAGNWIVYHGYLNEGKFEREWQIHEIAKMSDYYLSNPIMYENDFEKIILDQYYNNKDEYVRKMMASFEQYDDFTKGDALLIQGRVLNDKQSICQSFDYYKKSLDDAPDYYAKAIVYETLYAIGRECGNAPKEYLAAAVELWKKMDVTWRADYEQLIIDGKPLQAKALNFEYPVKIEVPNTATKVVFGSKKIELKPTKLVLGQADRVARDWTSGIFSAPWDVDLRIGYFEGKIVNDIAKAQAAKTGVMYGTFVKKIGLHWYAPNEKGEFVFLVLSDKVERYPTTRFLTDDTAVLIDSHGISSLVHQAILHKADVIVGCCDYLDKILAAQYLTEKGISVVCVADRFLPYSIGFDSKNESIIGGQPLNSEEENVYLGGREVVMELSEPIVIEDISKPYPLQYYDAPARYFYFLEKASKIKFNKIIVDRENGINSLIKTTKENNAKIIAVRVVEQEEYQAVAAWLKENQTHRALLFHSAPYPFGYKILEEFPQQTTVADINPVFS